MIRCAVWGSNGHQLTAETVGPGIELIPVARLSDALVEGIDAVSVCSPRRDEQGGDVLACLRAGKHVLAEKPLAMDARTVRRAASLASARGLVLAESGWALFEEPWASVLATARSGVLGRIRQLDVLKSYPDAPWRPRDEGVDGGLLLQAAVHPVRLAEALVGAPVARVSAQGKRDAAVLVLGWTDGTLATLTVNYLNPPSTGVWGWEQVRVFGEDGALEAAPGTLRLLGSEARQIPVTSGPSDYLARFFGALRGGPLPLPPSAQTHPTLVCLAARTSVRSRGRWVSVDSPRDRDPSKVWLFR